MNPAMPRELLLNLLRLGVGGLFVIAGVRKVVDPFQFLVDILNFQMVAYPMAVALALALPWLEMVAGFALGFRRWRASGLVILLFLLTGFSAVLVLARLRGLTVPCGCFGASTAGSGVVFELARNAVLLLSVGFLLWDEARRGKA